MCIQQQLNHHWMWILAFWEYVDPIQNVMRSMVVLFAHVLLECLVHRQIAALNVSSIKNVLQIVRVLRNNVKILALAHAVSMHDVQHKIINRSVRALKDMKVIHTLVAILVKVSTLFCIRCWFAFLIFWKIENFVWKHFFIIDFTCIHCIFAPYFFSITRNWVEIEIMWKI